MKRKMTIASVLGIFAFAGCGGDSDSGISTNCAAFSACGGAVEGKWTVDKTCLDSADLEIGTEDFCPTATVDASGLTTTGSIDAKADKTYTSSLVMGGKITMMLPASCLSQQGVTLTCAQLQQGVQAATMDPDSTIQSVTCTGSGSCTCTMTMKPQTTTEMGTYSTNGNILTTTTSDGDTDSESYCVSGNTLTVAAAGTTMSMGSMGSMAIKSYIVFKK